MEKNRVVNHSPSLFDTLGTEALALQNIIFRLKLAENASMLALSKPYTLQL